MVKSQGFDGVPGVRQRSRRSARGRLLQAAGYFFVLQRYGRAILGVAGASIATGFVLGLAFGERGVAQLAVLHLPTVWISSLLMVVITFSAAIGLVVQSALPRVFVQAIAPTGAMCSFLALASGALWARAEFGAWWVIDARQLAGLMLFCCFCAVVAIQAVIDRVARADKVVALAALVGMSLVPLIYFSAHWWSMAFGADGVGGLAVGEDLLPALIFVSTGFLAYVIYVVLTRFVCAWRERVLGLADASWMDDGLFVMALKGERDDLEWLG